MAALASDTDRQINDLKQIRCAGKRFLNPQIKGCCVQIIFCKTRAHVISNIVISVSACRTLQAISSHGSPGIPISISAATKELV